MMQPVGIDYTAAVHQSAGIGRYVRELAAALSDLHPEADMRLFVAGGRGHHISAPGGLPVRPSFLSERSHNRLWYRLRFPLPVETWLGQIGLYHATDFSLPPTLPGTKTVLTVHDLAYEHYPGETMPGMQRFLQSVVPRSARRADHVIAVSAATKADLVTLYGIPPQKISVILHGVDARFSPEPAAEGEAAELRQKYSIPPGLTILTVGTMQPRKNHLRLVRAFTGVLASSVEPHPVLVIAGGKGWQYEAVHAEVVSLGISSQVRFTGFVSDADLPGLYRLADILAYPALYEGFGFPVLEAMASGTPVVTSRTSSLPEVTGDKAALLVDPQAVDEISAALQRLLNDPDLRHRLRAEGLIRASALPWSRTAEQTWSVYEALTTASQESQK